MKLTRKQLKQIIKEELENVLEGTDQVPRKILDMVGQHDLEYDYDAEYLRWVIYFSTEDNTGWGVEEPEGWVVKKISQGQYDGDETYMIYEDSISGYVDLEKDVMKIWKDGIDPRAAAEKLATWYSYSQFEKYKEGFEFGEWKGPAMNALNNFNYDVLPIMMRIA